jgi:5-methylthioadenosine/S-adenosylhomocysteine deaminase
MSLLVKDALLGGERKDILVEGNRISEIGGNSNADIVVDGAGKAAIPGLVNTHSHAAMTLFRGYADDLALQEWLQKHIWPMESKMSAEDVYWGTRLACLEMIKSGTTCFSDMYWRLDDVKAAALDSGMRAAVSSVFIDAFGGDPAGQRKEAERQVGEAGAGGRVRISLGPHAIYTVTAESLHWVKELSDRRGLIIHLHLSETKKEVDDCVRENGCRPVEYLDRLGILGPNLVCAHAVWLSSGEIRLMAKHGVKVSHCPTSNMKLSVGEALNYGALRRAGVCVSLGTDGCASNNNLDMFGAMKTAALLAKMRWRDPTLLSAKEAFAMATSEGAKSLKVDAGRIAEGALADIVLVDLKKPYMNPLHNLASNLVYSASGGCVDTVICDGKVLMEDGRVEGEDEVAAKASEAAAALVARK